MLDPNSHVVDYVDDYLHDVLSPANAAVVEQHCRHCSECQAALAAARKRAAAFETLAASEAPERLIRDTLEVVATHERQRQHRRRWSIAGLTLTAAAAVALLAVAHVHYLRMAPTPYDLLIAGQNRWLAGTQGSLRVRLIDHSSGLALAQVPVDIDLHSSKTDQLVHLVSFTTNAQGSGEPRFRLPDWQDEECELRVTAHPAGGNEVIRRPVKLQRSWKLMLSSDKPVYQPGQEIHVRSLALRQSDLKPIAGQEAIFAITDPKGNLVFKHKEATSAYGISAIDYLLADEVIEGPYSIECRIGDSTSKLIVDVKKYVLPKFKIDVELDQPYYTPGQTVHGKVRVDYFFGKPVADAMVEVEARTTDVTSQVERRVSTRTDAGGAAAFELMLPQTLVGRPQNSGDARVAFQVSVTDSAGQKQSRTVSRTVTTQPLRVEVIPEAGTLVRDLPNTIYLYAAYADGRPARIDLVISGLRGWNQSRTLHTNSLGVASFQITETMRTVDFIVEGKDPQPPHQSCRRHVHLESGTPQGDFLVRADKAVYAGGDTMHLTALGGGQEPIFVDIIKDDQTFLTETINLTDGRGEYPIDLPPDLFGAVELCAYRFGAEGLPVRKTRTLYIHQARQLNIRATLDQPEYRPGHHARLQVALTDSQGTPTPGAVSLAAVDEAVFSVLEQAPGMERAFFTLEQQLLKPVYTIYPWSPDQPAGLPAAEQNQFEQAIFARTARCEFGSPGANVKQPIQEGRKGGSPLTLVGTSFPDKKQQVEATRMAGLKSVREWWIVLGVAAAVGIYITMWLVLPAAWMVLLHLGGLAVFIVMNLPAARMSAPFSKVSSAVGEANPVAEGAWRGAKQVLRSPERSHVFSPVEATVAGFGEGGNNAPVRVREWFPETLLWRPQVITDEQGRASIDMDLADSITTWRLSASAVTADGRLGAAKLPIRVFQPFFVDLNLPVALTRGDEVTVPVVVYNYLNKTQTVELTFAEAGWYERLDEAVKRIDLAAGEVRAAAYRLRAKQVGNHQLEVTARGTGVADAVKRSIEVVPGGRPVELVFNGSLTRPAELRLTVPETAIEGSPRAILKLYPSGFSQLVEGLDGIFQMPHGCFEQTSSTTYPNVLALDYLRRTHKSVPEVEAKARQYIHLGYQRLLSFEVSSGGFDWFGRPPANLTLTAYGLMEFQDMAKVHDVDPRLIERTRAWLLQQRQADGSWFSQGMMLHEDPTRGGAAPELARLSATAYVAWAVFGGQPNASDAKLTLDYLLSHAPASITDAHVLALVANALLALEPRGTYSGPYLDRLEEMKRISDDGRLTWWEQPASARTTFYASGHGSQIETTALATLALIHGQRHPDSARRALAWLVAQKGPAGTWYSTQATVLALKALLAGTGSALGGERERRFTLTWDQGPEREVVIPADQAEVMKQVDLSASLTPGPHRLTITEQGEGGTGYQLAFRYHFPGHRAEQRDALGIHLTYDRTGLAVGDTVTATATITNQAGQTVPMVMLDVPIPAGFALLAEDLDQLVKSGAIAKFQVTPRQAIVYLRGLEPGKELVVRYRLRATMPVKVTVPAARVYEYYAPDKQGQTQPLRMTVTPRGGS
jgi:hypothetical protein